VFLLKWEGVSFRFSYNFSYPNTSYILTFLIYLINNIWWPP